MPHQVTGAQWLASRFRGLALDPPGTGKTYMSLMAAHQVGVPVAIVCPAVAVGVWVDEIRQFAPDLHVRVQETTKETTPPLPGEYLVTTYDRANIARSTHRYGLIFDEAHLVKNNDTKRFRRARQLVNTSRSGFAWAMTGTPILRDPDDLWGILQMLGIERQTYRNRDSFLERWGGKRVMGEVRWGPARSDAWQPLSPLMLFRPRSSMFELPARTRETWSLRLSAVDYTRFQAVADQFPVGDQWESWTTGGELAAALKHLSLAKASLALGPIKDLAPSATNPVVVFTAHRAAAKLVAQEFGWPTITGETPEHQRTSIAQDFQAGKHHGVVCTIQAAGVALTLTRASTCVFVSQTWVHAANSQAEDRLYRIGQTREVRTILCRADSALEKSVDMVLARKVRYMSIPSSLED
jgi:superfamily II DNA or RNA helicase